MGKIVYHGTLSGKAPHEVDQPYFHAGTKESALDRLLHKSETTTETGEYSPGSGQVHAYEVEDTAPTSNRVFGDPMDRNPVPEGNIKKIHRYVNALENEGSTSMVIPTKFVGSHVRHLGVQFSDNLDNVLTKASQHVTASEQENKGSALKPNQRQKLSEIYSEL